MDAAELKKVLDNHKIWLTDNTKGERANLRWADLRWANLRGADLRRADLQRANLQGANLRWADLRWADLRDAYLRGADLRGADLQGADLDFSCFPLWCGSFDMKVDDRLPLQLIGHLVRLDVSACSPALKKWINSIPEKFCNDLCERHDMVEKVVRKRKHKTAKKRTKLG